ncbi:DgyrCDS7478 [Dimorphilus gyrociliatus]|uniref:DgyrCDS7478 n=1 Tax=Dimorphilus gyrociliatus TaxID=2664684 RepID=A0A7I8VR96_9ANNE|nr:DgyrCDS7478 [Dimorphilus gyrociliatus]
MSHMCIKSIQKILISRSYLSSSTAVFGRKTNYARNLPESEAVSNETLRKTPKKTRSKFSQEDSFGSLKSFSKRDKRKALNKESIWAENFGTLSVPETYEIEDSEKIKEEDRKAAIEKTKDRKPKLHYVKQGRYSLAWFGRKIEKLTTKGKVSEAIRYFENEMIAKFQIHPSSHTFTVLISGCAKIGHVDKAFELYEKMLKWKIEPVSHTYASLFNSIANSPYRSKYLNQAKELKHSLESNQTELHPIVYKTMLKLFALSGEIEEAVDIVEGMINKKMKIDEIVFSHLLMACISHKEAGLKLAIEVFRRMRRKYVKPTAIHYNLLLRAVRDCGAGTAAYSQTLLLPKSEKSQGETFWQSLKGELRLLNEQLLLDSGKVELVTSSKSKTLIRQSHNEGTLKPYDDTLEKPSVRDLIERKGVSALDSEIPDLLSNKRDNLTSVIELGNLEKAEHRLALLGGVPGILNHMKVDSASPDVKTLSLMLPSIPQSREAEIDLINASKAFDIALDIGFYNQLIKRRALRHDTEGCWEIFYHLTENNFQCDERTFGCLAMSCRNMADGVRLIGYLQVSGMDITKEICGILMQASSQNFEYKLHILEYMNESEIEPNFQLIKNIERDVSIAKKQSLNRDLGKHVEDYYKSKHFKEFFKKFMSKYKSWLLNTKLAEEKNVFENFDRTPENFDESEEQIERINL